MVQVVTLFHCQDLGAEIINSFVSFLNNHEMNLFRCFSAAHIGDDWTRKHATVTVPNVDKCGAQNHPHYILG